MTELTVVDQRLDEIETEIKLHLKRQWDDVLVVGRLAMEAKGLIPHGQYEQWVEEKIGLSPRLIGSYVRFYERLGKSEKFSVLPVSAGLLLASPSVPDGALAEVERRLIDGEQFKVKGIESIIDKYKVYQAAHIGGQVLLKEYGTKPDGRPAKQVNRSAVTSLVEVTGDALERGVVDIEGDDHPLPDQNQEAVSRPIPDLPYIYFTNTVKSAVNSATARRQSTHIEKSMTEKKRIKGVVAYVAANGLVTVLLDPDQIGQLSEGQVARIEFDLLS